LVEELEVPVMVPPPTTQETIKFGVKHSSDMMCFPYKVTLGNFKEALDLGANALLIWDTRGQCRFKHYWKLHQLTLKKLGYDFEIYPLTNNFIPTLKKLNPSLTTWRIWKALYKYWKKLRTIDEPLQQFSKTKINIALLGEVYTIFEESVNGNIEEKLKKLDAHVYFGVTLSDLIKDAIRPKLHIKDPKQPWKIRAAEFLNGPLGGHGYENVYNLMWLIDQKIDGVIHLLPLSCMPETTVEPIMNELCYEKGVPLLRFAIDETNSDANINTRLETFVELIKRKKLRK
jgi:predicted nucleotide-binding protein (sugar kinase/HSP70/actin superfamily)